MDSSTDELQGVLNELSALIALNNFVAEVDQQDQELDTDLFPARHHQSTLETDLNIRLHANESPIYDEDPAPSGPDDDEVNDGSDQEHLQALADLAAEQPESPLPRKGLSDWEKRCEAQHKSFTALRPALLQADLLRHALPGPDCRCSSCNNLGAQLVCLDCDYPGGKLLCGLCDVAAHPYAHLHRRQSISSGCLLPLHPLQAIDAEGTVQHRGGDLGWLLSIPLIGTCREACVTDPNFLVNFCRPVL